MAAPTPIHELISRFHDDQRRLLSSYNETEARIHYINPLFVALGWDMDNARGRAEVKHEDKVAIRNKAKAPDYGFYLDGRRRFFVEAKKPAVNLDQQTDPAYQLRRYAWTAKLPLSVLTDFEEFAVYDTRVRPQQGDSPKVARLRYWRYDQYADAWDEIAATFSRDAVLAGSLEQYAEARGGKKGIAPVDAEFLKEIERWRDLLARNIALRNPGIGERDLNFAVQQTIDRLLFLRIAEDRGIEPYGRLRDLATGGDVYSRLFLLYNQADARYNSGLFHFGYEKGRGDPDTLTPRLNLDDKALKDIIRNLYEPVSPYEFSVFPADILGQVYEQFLGKVIRLSGKSAKVEEKPEVRKAGGVYYTPTYIVDYIVRQTVGALLEGHTPDPTGPASRLRVLDPACGSGSFLLGAYRYLLDWHLRGYLAAPSKWSKGRNRTLHQTAAGEYHLTLAERKRILLDNLYGVDIDPQAVEVTKLSLLLRVLEDTPDALTGQMALLPERVLPDLGDNIKCGNSLIGPDFYNQSALFPDDAMLRINAFDWRAEFRDIMAAGGFDAVIGNPPYVRPHNIPSETKEYLWVHYNTFVAKSDLYSCFMEKGLTLTRPRGKFAFIVPHTWTSLESFTKIRQFVVSNSYVRTLTQLPKKVFADATVETCIFVVERKFENLEDYSKPILVERLTSESEISFIRSFPQSEIASAYLYNFQLYGREESRTILDKVKGIGTPLEGFVRFVYGFKTADDEQFVHPEKSHPESVLFIRSADVQRYSNKQPMEWVWYVPERMIRNRKTARPGEAARFVAEKIIVARMGKSLVATYDQGGLYVKDAMLLLGTADRHSLKYLLGLVNSRLMNYYYREYFITIDVLKNALLNLPIRTIDFTNAQDAARHARMVELVERMLDLHRRHAAEGNPQMKTLLQRQIDAADKQIDALVYALYDLTDDEIAIVEA